MSMQQKSELMNRMQLALKRTVAELKQVLEWLQKYQLPPELIVHISVGIIHKLYLLEDLLEEIPEQEKELKPMLDQVAVLLKQIAKELMKRGMVR